MKKYLVNLGIVLLLLGVVSLYHFLNNSFENNKETIVSGAQVAGSSDSTVTPSKSSQNTASTADYDRVQVKRVVDGDTIELETGQKLRYIGINTPETVDPRTNVQCFGKEASAANKKLVEGKKVRLEKDVSETDKYGRLLRYVYLQENGQEVFVNQYLVAQGFAQASSYPPDLKYQSLFNSAQKEAQNKNLGLWASCMVKQGVKPK